MITNQPWFAPKEFAGWGWRPISWQGWLVTAAFVAVVGAAVVHFGPTIIALVIGVVSLAAFYVVILLTGAKPRDPDSY